MRTSLPEVTVRLSPCRELRGFPVEPPPRSMRRRPKDRSVVEVVQSLRCSHGPRACARWRCACLAWSTTKAKAGSRGPDRPCSPHRRGRIPRRWHAALAGRARTRCRGALSARAGIGTAGTSWHAVGDEGDTVRDIATVAGKRLGVPVKAVPQDMFGPFGPIFAVAQPSSSARNRAALGWQPTHASLLEGLKNIRP